MFSEIRSVINLIFLKLITFNFKKLIILIVKHYVSETICLINNFDSETLQNYLINNFDSETLQNYLINNFADDICNYLCMSL
jgi:hypothetical protein